MDSQRAGRIQGHQAEAINGQPKEIGIGQAVSGIPAGAAKHPLVVVKTCHGDLLCRS
jgi:hypothetical protein